MLGGTSEIPKNAYLFETVTAWKVDRAFLKALVEPFSPSEGPMRPFNLAHLGSASLLSGGPVPKKLERLATAFRKLGWEMNHIRIGRPTGSDNFPEFLVATMHPARKKGRRRLRGKSHVGQAETYIYIYIYVALTCPIRPHDMSTSCEGDQYAGAVLRPVIAEMSGCFYTTRGRRQAVLPCHTFCPWS